jgi:hypothetical protein
MLTRMMRKRLTRSNVKKQKQQGDRKTEIEDCESDRTKKKKRDRKKYF